MVERLANFWRECRHSPCLMTPLSAIILLLICIFSLATLVLQFPTFIIGLFLAPLTTRVTWFVEFLYPLGLARWGHITLLRMGAKGRNGVTLNEDSKTLKMHSRAIEQRIEVVKNRVYIHPLPQLLDNVGYLVICVPPRSSNQGSPIIGILVDCGDAASVLDQIELIRDVHYANIRHNEIQIHALLCTHKHHDHTAGNKGLLSDHKVAKTLTHVYGGAIEKVPYCNKMVIDGEYIQLPTIGQNVVSALIEIECVSVPSHTRGSIVYVLRNKPHENTSSMVVSHLFTGDAMFSGGGGVTFESDLQFAKEASLEKKTVTSRFKPNSGNLSVERCFAELLRRGVKDQDACYSPEGLAARQALIYPGHEYTLELLQRQMQQNNLDVNSQWNKHQPSVFFEIASQYFIAGHRRNLPRSTRVLTVPSSMKKEFKINPYFRSLKKRGELVIVALSLWYKHLHDEKKAKFSKFQAPNFDAKYLSMPSSFDDAIQTLKSQSSENTWNVNQDDFNRSVFTTVYTSDLDIIIEGLKNGRMPASSAATKLSKLSKNLEEPQVTRRPIPNTLLSGKKMYMGLLALAVLGSLPSGMTVSDSERMNLPYPVANTDRLMISKKRLISALFRLGLLDAPSGGSNGVDEIVLIINLLWEESRLENDDLHLEEERKSFDYEVQLGDDGDLLELGALKLSLFGVAYNQPTWFKKYCMPCNSTPETISKSQLNRSGGELVKHDVTKCPICATLGCPLHNQDDDDISFDASETGYHNSTRSKQNGVRIVAPTTPTRQNAGDIELKMMSGGTPERKGAKSPRSRQRRRK